DTVMTPGHGTTVRAGGARRIALIEVVAGPAPRPAGEQLGQRSAVPSNTPTALGFREGGQDATGLFPSDWAMPLPAARVIVRGVSGLVRSPGSGFGGTK